MGSLEVCIDSLKSAINAIHGGADELEVCSSLPEGGLTPSPGLVKEILKMVENLACKKSVHKTCNGCSCHYLSKLPKINVMIRCRTGSDFCYTEEEMDTMLSDIEYYKLLNINRFVFGALTSVQVVDEDNCLKVITAAHPVPVTFHRAFDVCENPYDAIEKIIKLGFNRLLTSGQQPSTRDAKSIELIKTLLVRYGEKLEIMPGAGINVRNAKEFMSIGCKIIHSSCKCLKKFKTVKNNLCMGTGTNDGIYYTDENIVKDLKEIISKTELGSKKKN